MNNRYKGNCHYCGAFVAAGAGEYDYGKVSCTEYIWIETGTFTEYHCLASYNHKYGTQFATRDDAQQHVLDEKERAIAEWRIGYRDTLVGGGLQELAAIANVKSLAQVIAKVTGADIDIAELTFEQARDVRVELDKRIARKTSAQRTAERKRDNTCSRCGGAGRSDRWSRTGHVCYKCGGSGKFYN